MFELGQRVVRCLDRDTGIVKRSFPHSDDILVNYEDSLGVGGEVTAWASGRFYKEASTCETCEDRLQCLINGGM